MQKKNMDKLIESALAIEAQAAKEAGALGFMVRSLVQATLPHSDPGPVEAWGRKNGDMSLVIQPGFTIDENKVPLNIGIPYGTKPRLLMAFIASEVVKTRSKEIVLGSNLSEFMRRLKLTPTGGRWGTITALKTQMKRLFSATISFQYNTSKIDLNVGFKIASKTVLFWDNKPLNRTVRWESTVLLSQEFYDEIIEHPIPVDMRALLALKGSSLALDIYCWLTYRISYLKKTAVIPWKKLQTQFGSGYPATAQGIRDFKKRFLQELKKVYCVYSSFKAEPTTHHFLLHPSKTHVSNPKNTLCDA